MLKIQTMQLFREWRTPGGGRPLAQIPLELSWFTLEELGVLTTSLKEEQLRKFVYLTILITFLGHWLQISHGKAWFRVLSINFFPNSPISSLLEQNAPCAICDVPTRSRAIMVPAKTMCPPSWTRKYYGYLTTEADPSYRSSYTCLDINPDVVAGASANTNPSLFYHAVTGCNGLSCPPYKDNHVLSCAVCTKWSHALVACISACMNRLNLL